MLLFGLLVYFPLSTAFTDKYKILPPVYEIEDYYTCLEHNDLYCKIDVSLENSTNNKDILWELIKESLTDKYSYDRNIIHRGICVPRKEADNLESIKKFSELHISKKLNETKLLSHVEDFICTSNEIGISSLDIVMLICSVVYVCLVLYATMYDTRKSKLNKEYHYDKLILSFSLKSNWKKLCCTEGNEDYNKLKSIQGIRFYNMTLIICLHTLYSLALTNLSNPEALGKFFLGGTEYVMVLCSLLVQTFFLISSWIVTFQIYNFYNEHGEFTAKHVCICIINRSFRLGVCSTVAILIAKTSLPRLLVLGPITMDALGVTQRACEQNWLYTIFFINNHLYPSRVCNPLSWYLSVDLQLYVMTVITLYIIFKFKLNEAKVIGFLLFLSCILYGAIIYTRNMDIIVRFNAKYFRIYTDLTTISILYFSTPSNWSTGIVGLGLGILYTKNKNREVTNNKIVSCLWLLIFFGLPLAIILIAKNEFSGIAAAIIGPLVKPLFSFGIGIGILGMSHNLGGVMKRICENKYVIFMSNFSYSTYVFQIAIVFFKGMNSHTLLEFRTSSLVWYFLFVDMPLSLLLGFILALFLEQSFINLQKMFLPQLPRNKKLQEKER